MKLWSKNFFLGALLYPLLDRSLIATRQCWPSDHPSKYWPYVTLLAFSDRRSKAPTVQPPVSVRRKYIINLNFIYKVQSQASIFDHAKDIFTYNFNKYT